jgi:ParB-like chromosome segregation protein Spo0J
MDYCKTSDLRPAKWATSCYVVAPDYKRLSASIDTYGILSPIVIQKDGAIIDGHHRWIIANELRIKKVPVVVVRCDDVEAIMLHIDMNRYRGIVIAKYLSRLMQRLMQSKRFTEEELRKRLGMTYDEFDILLDGSLVKMRKIKQHTYSPAWVPIESKTGEDIYIERPTGHSEQA